MQPQLRYETTAVCLSAPPLAQWVSGFLLARRAEGRAAGTLAYYRFRLAEFVTFAAAHGVTTLEAVDASLCREFLVDLAERHNSGGVSGYYRTLRAFLCWYADEAAADGWRNPLDKVKPPRVDLPPLPPADTADISRMIAACAGPYTTRDRAILLLLADVGLRAGELCGLRLEDFDQTTGALTVACSKSRKPRTVYMGKAARRALRVYLAERGQRPGALFLSQDADHFKVNGLRQMVTRRAAAAGVKPPPLHSFRRAAALALVRNGADLLTVSRILGHSGLSLLQRYVNQTGEDLRQAAEKFSPGDKL